MSNCSQILQILKKTKSTPGGERGEMTGPRTWGWPPSRRAPGAWPMSRHVKIDEKFGWNESKLMRSLDAINSKQASDPCRTYVCWPSKPRAPTRPDHKRPAACRGVPSVFCYGWLAVDGKRPWNRAFYFRAHVHADGAAWRDIARPKPKKQLITTHKSHH